MRSGAAAYLTASVRLALTESKTWQRLPDGFRSAELLEWKSRSRDSGVGAGTKLVLRSAAEEDELDRFLWGRQLNCVKAAR